MHSIGWLRLNVTLLLNNANRCYMQPWIIDCTYIEHNGVGSYYHLSYDTVMPFVSEQWGKIKNFTRDTSSPVNSTSENGARKPTATFSLLLDLKFNASVTTRRYSKQKNYWFLAVETTQMKQSAVIHELISFYCSRSLKRGGAIIQTSVLPTTISVIT